MTIVLCPACEEDHTLGPPSYARWLGPDGVAYCSLHLVNRFGHGEPLVRLEDYEPPPERKPPAPMQEGAPKPKRKRTRSSPKKEEPVDG